MDLGYTTYVELDEEVVEGVEKVLGEHFHRKGNLVPIAEINDTLRDLLIEIDRKEEELEELEENLQEYRDRRYY